MHHAFVRIPPEDDHVVDPNMLRVVNSLDTQEMCRVLAVFSLVQYKFKFVLKQGNQCHRLFSDFNFLAPELFF